MFIGPSKDTTVFNSDKTTRRWLVLLAVIITAVYTAISLSLYIYWANSLSCYYRPASTLFYTNYAAYINDLIAARNAAKSKTTKSFYSHLINHYLYCRTCHSFCWILYNYPYFYSIIIANCGN